MTATLQLVAGKLFRHVAHDFGNLLFAFHPRPGFGFGRTLHQSGKCRKQKRVSAGNLPLSKAPDFDYRYRNQEATMTLHFFAQKPTEGDGKRYRAANTVRAWLWSRNHLPKDLVAALHYLIPELKREMRGGAEEDS